MCYAPSLMAPTVLLDQPSLASRIRELAAEIRTALPDDDIHFVCVLKGAFPFGDAPFGVAIENGRQKESFIGFENGEPAGALRKIGFIE